MNFGKVNKKILLMVMLAAMVINAPLAVAAQESTVDKAVKSNPARRTAQRRGRDRQQPVAVKTAAQKPVAPVPTVTKPAADYIYGEASSVTVDPRKPTVIKVGLAQNATCVIEFTASDSLFYHHEGNQQLVAVFDSPTMATDHFITVYPGEGFVSPPKSAIEQGARVPSSTITLQMTSGLVITIIFVPVSDITMNAHRVVINYNREEVIAARRAAGLDVNLDGRLPANQRPNANSVRVGSATGGQETNDGNPTNRPVITPIVSEVDSVKADSKPRTKKTKKPSEISEAANKALVAAVKSPDKLFTKWSPYSNGMSVSLAPAVDVDDRSRVVVVAVRNVSTAGIRLVPGTPDIYIQNFDERGTPLRLEPVNRLQVETTALAGRIPAGQVVYYAIIYETPILAVNERLRVSVSQSDAADQSVTADMTNGTK